MSPPFVALGWRSRPTPAPQEFLKRGAELRAQGARHFQLGEVEAALSCFEQCGRLLGKKHADAALVACHRASCHLRLGNASEALRECNAALKARPNDSRAALLRARCHEAKGHLHQALEAISALRKAAPALEEARVEEERLRRGVDAMNAAPAGKKHEAAAAAMGGNTLLPGQGDKGAKGDAAAAKARRGPPPSLRIRCHLDDDVRMVEVPAHGTFEDVKRAVRAKYPGAGTLALKYQDEAGMMVTVAGLADLRTAIQLAAVKAMRERIEAEKAAKEGGEVAKPPPMGLPVTELQAVRVVKGGAIAPVGDAVIPAEDGEEVEMDDWMFDFADLFRQQLGVDPDAHVAIQAEGMERCQDALEAVATSTEAQPLFDAAADKFQEVAALALFNWGNVHMCCARKKGEGAKQAARDKAAGAGGGADAGAQEDPLALLSADEALTMDTKLREAEVKYKESLAVKDDFYEALVAWGQQCFERAKLFQAQEGVAKAALARPAAERGFTAGTREAAVDELYALAIDKYQASLAMLPGVSERQAEAARVAAEKAHAAAVRAGSAEPGSSAPQEQPQDLVKEVTPQVLVMWGNVLYEQSAILSRKGSSEWKALLIDAVRKFKDAGCGAGDIKGALARHAAKDAAEVVKAAGVEVDDSAEGKAAEGEGVTASHGLA